MRSPTTGRSVIETLGAALRAVRARAVRALLVAAGTAVGVGIVVASQGLLLSGSGSIRAELDALGTNLLVVNGPDGGLPPEVVDRAASLPTVTAVAGATLVEGAPDTSARVPGVGDDTVSTAVWAVSPGLLDLLRARIVSGRDLGAADEAASLPAAVLGARIAASLALDEPFGRTMWIGDHQFAVVGVLSPVPLAAEYDTAVLVPYATASVLWGDVSRPSRLYVRTDPAAVAETAEVLPDAVAYDAERPTVRVASELLEAAASIDRGLAGLYLGVGALAVAIGTLAIYNTMHLSMLERRAEIGLRRAIGHPRSAVAAQFVVESAIVGLAGAVIGLVGGVALVTAVARLRGWPIVLNVPLSGLAVLAATTVAVLVGGLVAIRAARLEPLDALRS